MSSIFPFASEHHPVWSPLAVEIHTTVWDRVGLPTVQGLVRQWADSCRRAQDAVKCRERARREYLEPWAESLGLCLDQCFDLLPTFFAYLPEDLAPRKDPPLPELPLPPDDRSLSLAERWAGLAAIHDVYWKGDKINPWPLPAEQDDWEAWKRWLAEGSKFQQLMERVGRLADTDEPFIARWLKDATADLSDERQRDFDAFVTSAKDETSTDNFQDWAGGERVTLAIVFTDVVGSTALGEEIRDEAMNEVRRAHFAQSRNLIGQFQGREIKTIGDSFMAAFKCADAALDYARALQGNTGHAQVKIRAGIHIGPMHVEEGDVFGGTVNFAARVVGAIQGAEIWLSDQAKDDIDRLGAGKHKQLRWERHDGVTMKGFPEAFTLWSLKKSLG